MRVKAAEAILGAAATAAFALVGYIWLELEAVERRLSVLEEAGSVAHIQECRHLSDQMVEHVIGSPTMVDTIVARQLYEERGCNVSAR